MLVFQKHSSIRAPTLAPTIEAEIPVRFSLSTPPPRCRKRRAVPQNPDIHYTCQRCTNCCRWPGVVRVGPDEIAAIAASVRMSEEEFIQCHTRLRPDRLGLSLKEMPDGACEWLDGRDCRLQEVKPAQCRAFPNDWNFPGWREKCEATPVLVRNRVAVS